MNTEEKIAKAFSGIVDIQRHMVGLQDPGLGLGERMLESKQVQNFMSGKADMITVGVSQREIKTAILGTGAANDPLSGTSRLGLADGPRRRLFIRDLLTPGRTDEAAVEYPIEDTFTNNAAPQNGQNTALAESGITFDLSFQPCETIGHFVHVSKQLLNDSAVFNAFLQNSLLYGVRLAEEDSILNGNGTSGALNGLLKAGNFTPFNRTTSPLGTARDTLGRALTQIELADFSPSGIVLNPVEWETIKLSLNVETGYMLFDIPVAVSNSIASGTFLVGDFQRAAVLFDREDAKVEVSHHNASNYEKNMITVKADERVSLVVTNPLALVSGSL